MQELFFRALELDAHERIAFVRRESQGDPSLADEVCSLLHHHDPSPHGFLDDPVAVAPSLDALTTALTADGAVDGMFQIAGFRIEERLGEGGMGIVVRAHQFEPLERTVAIKFIKWGFASREARARFDLEQRMLATLAHENVARVFDAGTTRSGQPYFVLEFIEGRPITEHCDAERLNVESRLRLFLQVLSGVEHAHRRGIIHRDLKPTNILVTASTPATVKVIDFGIAKVVGDDSGATVSERTMPQPTIQGQVLGTRDYMSPEQADGRTADIDTRSDVFALGVVLHELLVGRRPVPEADGEWTRPSRASTMLASATPGDSFDVRAVAEARSTRVEELARRLAGDLDAILMSALECEVDDRYASVTDLKAEIERYLNHEPLVTRSGSLRYRLGKYLKRRRAWVLSAALVLVTLIGGLAVSTWAYWLADERLDELYRLSDAHRLARYVAESEKLYPATPERIPQFEDWLGRAHRLAGGIELHRETLAGLGDPTGHDDDEWRWRRDNLHALITNLEAFADPETGTIADVERRLDWARRVERASIDDHSSEWQLAIDSIADPTRCPKYRGLRIETQIGLVPLRRDPQSGLWEFVDIASAADPRVVADHVSITPQDGVVFVLLPRGRFTFGAQQESPERDNYDRDARADEGPVESFEVDAFFLAKYEITQAQWQRLTGHNPSKFPHHPTLGYCGRLVTPCNPVEKVSWQDCHQLFFERGWRLPSQREWEYGARAGTHSVWWCGDEPLSLRGVANFADDYARRHPPSRSLAYDSRIDDGHAVHAPVGSYRANAFGLHDVHGNVWEWCSDEFVDEVNRDDGSTSVRIARGGSFVDPVTGLRSANRDHYKADFSAANIGVRAARSLTRREQ